MDYYRRPNRSKVKNVAFYQEKIKRLEQENLRLQKEVSKLSKEAFNVKARQIKTQQLVKQKDISIKRLKSINKRLNIKVASLQSQQKPKSFKNPYKKGTPEHSHYWRDTWYVPQFIRRLKEMFPDMENEWLATIDRVTKKLSMLDLTFLIKSLGLERMYFESDDTYYANMPVIEYSGEEIYEVFSRYDA